MSNKIKVETRSIDEAVDVMVDLWVNKIKEGEQDSGDSSINSFLSLMKKGIDFPSEKRFKKFRGALKWIVLKKIEENIPSFQKGYLTVDYGPCSELAMACEESGINPMLLPIKSSTWIEEDNSVTSRFGYRADFETH